MTDTGNKRRPSPLQRSILVVLAALDARRLGPVDTRDIERLLAPEEVKLLTLARAGFYNEKGTP